MGMGMVCLKCRRKNDRTDHTGHILFARADGWPESRGPARKSSVLEAERCAHAQMTLLFARTIERLWTRVKSFPIYPSTSIYTLCSDRRILATCWRNPFRFFFRYVCAFFFVIILSSACLYGFCLRRTFYSAGQSRQR